MFSLRGLHIHIAKYKQFSPVNVYLVVDIAPTLVGCSAVGGFVELCLESGHGVGDGAVTLDGLLGQGTQATAANHEQITEQRSLWGRSVNFPSLI